MTTNASGTFVNMGGLLFLPKSKWWSHAKSECNQWLTLTLYLIWFEWSIQE
jgi:hypothetical protein